MSRTFVVLLAVLPLVGVGFPIGCRPVAEPLRIEVERLPKGTRVLDIGKLRMQVRSIIYSLTVESRTDQTVNLKVRVESGATNGIIARLALDEPIRPAGRESLRLVIATPQSLGPFHATITLFADELPGWTREYKYKGTVVDIPLHGNYIELRPAGIDLGVVRLGQKKKFAFELANIGDADISISELRVHDNANVRLLGDYSGATIKSRESLKVEGEARVAGQGKRFETRIDIVSDAVNGKLRTVVVRATVQRDYDMTPERLPTRSAYALLGPKYNLKVRAAKGVAPFVVSGVAGMAPLFELSEPLSKKPAAVQTIALRLRRDAPTGQDMLRGALRISIEPSGVLLAWPYSLRVLPPLFAQPVGLDFGTVNRAGLNKPIEKRVRIVALPGRTFKVTAARAEQRRFQARVAEHKAGMSWEVIVVLPALADKGIYRDRIMVETTDPDVPKLLIPVRAVVR